MTISWGQFLLIDGRYVQSCSTLFQTLSIGSLLDGCRETLHCVVDADLYLVFRYFMYTCDLQKQTNKLNLFAHPATSLAVIEV